LTEENQRDVLSIDATRDRKQTSCVREHRFFEGERKASVADISLSPLADLRLGRAVLIQQAPLSPQYQLEIAGVGKIGTVLWFQSLETHSTPFNE